MIDRYLAGVGRLNAQLHDFQFTKDRDSLSQAMMAHCLAGIVFDTVWVEIYQAGASEVYVTYTLSGVVIAAIDLGGSRESVGLNYRIRKPRTPSSSSTGTTPRSRMRRSEPARWHLTSVS